MLIVSQLINVVYTAPAFSSQDDKALMASTFIHYKFSIGCSSRVLLRLTRQHRKVLWVAVTCCKLSASLRLAARKDWKNTLNLFPWDLFFRGMSYRWVL